MDSYDAAEVSEFRRALDTSSLELAHEKNAYNIELLVEQEKARRLRVQILAIEDEKEALCEELLQDDDRIAELETIVNGFRTQLLETGHDLQLAQSDSRGKEREINNLKAELTALNRVSTDSARLLTEKLGLTRELANLKPELEYLRSQTEAHQSVLAEKLSLQRELNTTQLELETERRTTQRSLAKEEKNHNKDIKLERRIEDLQKELAQERRDKQNLERDSQKELDSWEGKKMVLEGKLEAFRNKIRTTKEQLKQTEADLQKAKVSTGKPASRSAFPGDYESLTKNARKRSAAHLDMDATIGTPGLPPPAKRGKRGSTLPGDKSAFSITPFLNRTASVAPDTPPHKDVAEDAGQGDGETSPQADDTTHPGQAISESKTSKSKVDKRRAPSKSTSETHTLGAVRIGKMNTKPRATRKPSVLSSLDNVAEEQNDENEPPLVNIEAGHQIDNISGLGAPSLVEELEPKKRKRKFFGGGLGKTLFDDEDGEHVKVGSRGPLGIARGFGGLGKGGLVGTTGSSRLGLVASTAVFGSFSPLKKDKKTNNGA